MFAGAIAWVDDRGSTSGAPAPGLDKMNNEWSELSMQAFRNQDIARAHELLTGYVRCNNEDAGGWVRLSRIADRREEKIQCLERALDLAPFDQDALEEWASVAGGPKPAAPRWDSKQVRAINGEADKARRVARLRWAILAGAAIACLAVGWVALTM